MAWTAKQKKQWQDKLMRALGDPQGDEVQCAKAQKLIAELPAAERRDPDLQWEYYADVVNQRCGDSGEFGEAPEKPKRKRARRPRREKVKTVEREDGSVVRDMSDIDLDAGVMALAREVRGPLGLSQEPGWFMQTVQKAKELLSKPIVYVPLVAVGGYMAYRWWKKRKARMQRPVGYTPERARQLVAARDAAAAEAAAADPQRAMEAEAEAELQKLEAEAAEVARQSPPEAEYEDSMAPNVSTYVN